MRADQRRNARHGRRLSRRLLWGTVIGALACGLVGLVVGLIVFRPWSTAMWLTVAGSAFFGACVGALAGGMSALESPDPGEEPSQFERPVTEPSGLTTKEHDHRDDTR
jgi:hypothetical protein